MEFLKISLLVFLGGGFGSLARFGVSRLQMQLNPQNFPIGTLTANILACTILGLVIMLSKGKLDENDWIKYFLVIGFCGGFSTFSTFGFETVQLFKTGFFTIGVLNVFVSLSLGFLILWAFIKP